MSYQAFLQKHHISPKNINAVHGGDINKAWRIETAHEIYFLKENNAAAYPGMMQLEAEGLLALREGSDLYVPQVIAQGEENGQQFLLLEWLENCDMPKTFWEDFGKSLARMHLELQPYFGWDKDNYIGSLVQLNTVAESWADFYCQYRIMPMAEKLDELRRFTKQDMAAIQKLCTKMNTFFPHEPASLLHGDLWSGNFMCGNAGKPCVYDPAVYFGHGMDLGMSRLFGGFDSTFYQAYQEAYPLAKGWQDRIQLTQLYPVMVHAVLFGGHYVQQAINIVQQYI